jgi:hypothetical protein
MPAQTVGNVHVNALLTDLAVKYMPKTEGFIADEVAPYLGVRKESDQYPTWTTGPFFATDVDDLVPDREEPRIVDYEHTYAAYQTQHRALAWDISDRERENADDVLDLESTKQQATLARLMLKREARVAAMLRKTSNGGSLNLGANASAKWDNAATTYQTIATDIMAGKTAVRQAIGTNPNVIVIPILVAEGMHKSLLFQLTQYTSDASSRLLEPEFPVLPPVLFGMRVLVGGAISNTAVEGQTASFAEVWGEAVRMLYVAPGPALMEPSVAYTFRSRPLRTWQDRLQRRGIDWYATGQVIDERVVAANAGYEINDCLT